MLRHASDSPTPTWVYASWVALILGLGVTGAAPYDRVTWLMEVAPVIIALPLLWWTRDRFRLTPLLYALIAIHAVILMVGGMYSYARVPLGYWVQEWLSLSRNPYDKLGHFAQGFVPAILAREIFLRRNVVPSRRWMAFLIVCVVLAISATYELIEWLAAVLLGQGADEFLGLQGDPWDTQSDMALAGLGAIVALLALGRTHTRQLARK